VSFDIFFQRFDDSRADGEAVMALIEPFVAERSDSFVRIELSDGGADVYVADAAAGAMVNHASGRAVWDLMYDLALAGRFAVLSVGCGTCVPVPAMVDELPDYVPKPITVVGSGGELLHVVESA
jgi:hypothetical protein